MQYIEKNLSALAKRDAQLALRLQQLTNSDVDVVISKEGGSVPLCSGNDQKRKVAVHSKFAPLKEAKRFIEPVDVQSHNLFIVIGFGFAYHVVELLKKIHSESTLLVVEKSMAMIRAAFENCDLTTLLLDSRLVIIVDPDDEIIAEKLRGKSSKKTMFLIHRGSFQIDPDYYKNINRKLRSYLSTKEVNIATLAKFEKLWMQNCAKNCADFATLPGVQSFYGNFKGMDSVIVGAGPSLRNTLEQLKEVADKILLIAIDTSYQILQDAGLEPHFCLCVDPQLINARYFEGVKSSKTILVADPTVHPSVFHLFQGRKCVSSMPFDTLKWIETITGEKGEITHGGSVSTNAYDFAKRLGANKIYIVGQDLSFTNSLAHCRGSYLDEMMFLQVDRFFNQEMFNRRQLTALPKIFVPSIDGTSVHTNQKMIIFQNWFEKRNDDNLINATLEGVLLKGVEHKQLNSHISKSKSTAWETIDTIWENEVFSHTNYQEICRKLIKRIELLQNENEILGEKIKSAIKHAKALQKAIETKSPQVGSIIEKLDRLDEYIEKAATSTSLVGMSVQKLIHTINEGYDISENEELSHEKIAERSLFLYTGLDEGAEFIRKILIKMKNGLHKKIDILN